MGEGVRLHVFFETKPSMSGIYIPRGSVIFSHLNMSSNILYHCLIIWWLIVGPYWGYEQQRDCLVGFWHGFDQIRNKSNLHHDNMSV